ncbi:TolC family protein [Achromobacter sp. DH1f]|uniref:TolC family protein n=1 Tax=Achromobacter sp. DH1f TaxID=1397275 RepID=UPI00046979F1|nr:TolC family protein [Achromobacter sp. DH1f]
MKAIVPLSLALPLWLGAVLPAQGAGQAAPASAAPPAISLTPAAASPVAPPPTRPSSAAAPAGRPVTIAEALALAQGYSMRLTMASARVDAAQAGIASARAAYYPKLQALAKTDDAIDRRYTGYRRTNDEYGQAQLSLQYTALDFGRRAADLARNEFGKQGNEFAYRQETADLQFDTVRAYVDSERYRRMQRIANEHTTELRRLASLMEERVRGGLSPQSELIRSRLALTNAQNRQKTIIKNFDQAQQSLRALTGETIQSEPLALKLDTIDVATDVLAASVEGNYSLQSLRAQLQGADAGVDRARADRYPKVDLIASYKKPFEDQARGLGTNVYAQVTLDIFDGGLKSARIDEAGAAQREARAKFESTRRELRDAADRLVFDVNTTYEQWQLSTSGQEEAARTRSLYLEEFRLGSRSLNDLISAQNDYFTQRVDNVDAYSNHILSVLGLFHVAGRMSDGLDTLGLVAQTTRSGSPQHQDIQP